MPFTAPQFCPPLAKVLMAIDMKRKQAGFCFRPEVGRMSKIRHPSTVRRSNVNMQGDACSCFLRWCTTRYTDKRYIRQLGTSISRLAR